MRSKLSLIDYIIYWLPPLLWMGCIFYMSSQSHILVTHSATSDFIIFKSLHVVEYALLYFLFFRAFYCSNRNKPNLKFIFLSSFILSVIFAVSDEFHQLFTPTRQPQIRDIAIDIIGIFIIYCIIRYKLPLFKKLL
ncbi:hypothetical protein COY87_05280 [Candidatus Roizmanbacteria bacterium CG_4_10_14_0_8_um_filter_33_9]|uniref:VanZ-like domain-containing protein n=1 Tax=Candidatus Roizmanbacteria bacterium CG_4_10_14_0_8_um_filter_33_9 TaxID=1974826 RepID=A0A2M7QH07_9BACT|nr:MAG: hypothetical protein COY87_05280 [Candidatus Roizmanbacteria bacterium CG_4_10_14_0_8_um_filter_33_9]